MGQYSKTRPETIFEAARRLDTVQSDIASITAEIGAAEINRYRIDIVTGQRLTDEQFETWIARARGAYRHMLIEKSICERYIAEYRREAKRDEIAELRNVKAQAVINRARELGAEEALSRMNHHRKVTYKRWLKLLDINEKIEPMDSENLLRHAYRLFKRLAKERRVQYSDTEQALIDLIEQLPRIKDAIEDGLGDD